MFSGNERVFILVSLGLICLAAGCGGGGGAVKFTPTYSVSVTVTGLSGTLVLQNNGGDDLTLTTNGAHTFDTELADGATYAVTASSDPVNQNVTVTSGSGTIDEADVSGITVTCADKTWTHPSSLTDNISVDGQDCSAATVAMGGDGITVVAWLQSNGSNTQVYISEYRSGAWSHPSALTDNISFAGQDCAGLQVAMDSSGNTLVVWSQSNGTNTQIFKSEYRGGAWTHPTSLADNISVDGQDASNPQVAMDDNGNALIVWQQSNGVYTRIFKSEYRSSAWTHPSSLSDGISPTGSDAIIPQVAMDNDGNALIAWEQGSVSRMIFKSEYRSSAWTHPLNTGYFISPGGQHAQSCKVAMDDDDNAIIAWQQKNASGDYQIFKSEYRSGSWTHPVGLDDNISPDGQDAVDVFLCMDDNGHALIAWRQNDGAWEQIFKSEYRSSAWTHPSSLSNNISPGSRNAYLTGAAVDDSGNAAIVWYESDGTYNRIFKSEYRSSAWSHPADLTAFINADGSSGSNPRVALDASCNAVIVWCQSDGSNEQTFISEYR